MYLFFDSIYNTLEDIGQDNIIEFSHKETPVLRYAILTHEMAVYGTLDAGEACYLAKTMEEAVEELEEY
jgi:hypothetical protein